MRFLEEFPDTLLIDVRDPPLDDWIPGTLHVSLGTLFYKADPAMSDGLREPDLADRRKDGPLLLTCALGGQALVAATVLKGYGFTNVKVIDGGCMAWKSADLPYEDKQKNRDASRTLLNGLYAKASDAVEAAD